MEFPDVLLYLRGLFRALSAREIAEDDRWKLASRQYFSRTFAEYVCGHGDPKSDAIFVTRPAGGSESLDEYRLRRGIHGDHDFGDQGWLERYSEAAALYFFFVFLFPSATSANSR